MFVYYSYYSSLLLCTFLFCYSLFVFFFFFKQRPSYVLRIIDWSSDVCSSDLYVVGDLEGEADVASIGTQRTAPLGRDAREDRARLDRKADQRPGLELLQPRHGRQVEIGGLGGEVHHLPARHARRPQLGRASGRERGCRYR